MVQRYNVPDVVDVSILGEPLVLPTSKKVVRNRFLKSALSEYIAPWDPKNPAITGLPGQYHVNMYEKWSAGGYGITITGNVVVDENHLESPGNTIFTQTTDSPARRAIFKQIAEAGKRHGGLIIAQLSHAGRQTPLIVNSTPYAASTTKLVVKDFGRSFGGPVELTTEQIKPLVIDKFVYAAKALYETGFDGIQIHGAHGYLIAQFLSPTTNHRTDRYGGPAENRARIVTDIYEAIRKEIPVETGFVVGIKLNSVEFQAKGLQTDDAAIIARVLDEAGLDFIELSGGTYEKFVFSSTEKRGSTIAREAYFFEFAKQIRPAVKKAVLYVTGGFRTAPAMVNAIKDGACDGIGLGRPATQEFDIPKRFISGEIKSTATWPFADDFLTAVLACSLQMSQAAQKTLAESSNINEGISDWTDDDVVTRYLEAQKNFLASAAEAAQKGQVVSGVVPFELPTPADAGA